MLTVFLYTMMCYGVSAALVYYNGPFGIFSRLRCFFGENDLKYLEELFSCMFCLPVNVGIIMSVLSLVLSPVLPFTPFTVLFRGHTSLWPLIILFDGFYTGTVVSIIDSVVDKFTVPHVDSSEKILLNG